MPRKEFEAFTRLDASDINDFLMDQTIMVFSGTAARGSAIATPIEGMYAHLSDTDELTYYTGSAWENRVPSVASGLTLLADQAIGSATSSIVDNVFSSTYDNYQIVLNSTVSGTNTDIQINFRVAGVNASTNYNDQFIQATSTTVTAAATSSATVAIMGRLSVPGGILVASIYGVALAERTIGVAQSSNAGVVLRSTAFNHTTADAYDGFRLQFATATTGNVRVYGLRNS